MRRYYRDVLAQDLARVRRFAGAVLVNVIANLIALQIGYLWGAALGIFPKVPAALTSVGTSLSGLVFGFGVAWLGARYGYARAVMVTILVVAGLAVIVFSALRPGHGLAGLITVLNLVVGAGSVLAAPFVRPQDHPDEQPEAQPSQ